MKFTVRECATHFKVGHWPRELPPGVWNDRAAPCWCPDYYALVSAGVGFW